MAVNSLATYTRCSQSQMDVFWRADCSVQRNMRAIKNCDLNRIEIMCLLCVAWSLLSTVETLLLAKFRPSCTLTSMERCALLDGSPVLTLSSQIPRCQQKVFILIHSDCDQKCPGEACLFQEAGRAVKMAPLGGHHGCEVLFNNVCDQYCVTKQHLFSSSSIQIEDSSYKMHLKGPYLSSLI